MTDRSAAQVRVGAVVDVGVSDRLATLPSGTISRS